VWTSRNIPIGNENPIDVMTMRFNVPIWISSPAKVKKLGVVERIINSIYDARGDLNNAITNDDLLLGTRQLISPFGYQVLLVGNKLQVLQQQTVVDATNSSVNIPNNPPSNELWQAVVGMYGVLRPGISQVRLDSPWDDTQVIGFVSYDPTDDRFLLFNVDEDTVPQNTLSPVNSIIDPLISGPSTGLAPAMAGQRYLILEDIGSVDNPVPAEAWGDVVARANDIIEYDGTRWNTVFDSATSTNIQFVTNITTGVQYRWTGQQWVKSYEGLYPGGDWSLVL
jgi:hypothetical protein